MFGLHTQCGRVPIHAYIVVRMVGKVVIGAGVGVKEHVDETLGAVTLIGPYQVGGRAGEIL